MVTSESLWFYFNCLKNKIAQLYINPNWNSQFKLLQIVAHKTNVSQRSQSHIAYSTKFARTTNIRIKPGNNQTLKAFYHCQDFPPENKVMYFTGVLVVVVVAVLVWFSFIFHDRLK